MGAHNLNLSGTIRPSDRSGEMRVISLDKDSEGDFLGFPDNLVLFHLRYLGILDPTMLTTHTSL